MAEDNNNKTGLSELTKLLNSQTSGNKKAVEQSSKLLDVTKKMAVSMRRLEQLGKLSLLEQTKLSNSLITRSEDAEQTDLNSLGQNIQKLLDYTYKNFQTSMKSEKHLYDVREILNKQQKVEDDAAREEARRARAEARKNSLLGKSFAKITSIPDAIKAALTPSKKSGGGDDSKGGGFLGRIGLGKAAQGIGKGLVSSAKGLAAMGVAIPAFFGGLMAGNAALGLAENYDGFDFNFDNIKKAAAGFSGIIKELDQDAIVALGGIMGLSAFAGFKGGKPAGAALSLGLMGAAISSFLLGLAIGDRVLEEATMSDIVSLDFATLKKGFQGLSDAIMGLSPDAMKIMGGLLAITGFAGYKAGMKIAGSIAVMGIAITAFIGGLALGDGLLDASGADLNFGSLGTAFKGFSDSITNLSTEAVVALAGIVGTAGLMSKFMNVGSLLKFAPAMAAIGVGLSAFMVGLGAGEYGLQALTFKDFGAMSAALEGFSQVAKSISQEDLLILGGVVGSGALMAKFMTIGDIGKFATALFAIGMAIPAFLGGFGAGDYALNKIDLVDYSTISQALTGFNDIVTSLDATTLAVLGGIVGAGGILGKFMGISDLGAMALAMTGIGLGIGGFLAGFAIGDYALSKITVSYESIKEAIKNFGEAVDSLSGKALTVMGSLMAAGGILALIGGFGGGPAFALAMAGIGLGIGGFFTGFEGVLALGGVMGLDGNAIADFMENVSRGLAPFENLDMLSLSAGLLALGPALLALMGTEGLLGLKDKVADSKFNPFNWFGDKEEDESTSASGGFFGRIARLLGDPNQIDVETINRKVNELDYDKVGAFTRAIGKITTAMKGFAGDDGFLEALYKTAVSFVSRDPLKPFMDLADRNSELFRAGIGLEKITDALEQGFGVDSGDKKGLRNIVAFAKDIGKEQDKLDRASISLKEIADSIVRINEVNGPTGNISGLVGDSIESADELRIQQQRNRMEQEERNDPGQGVLAVNTDNSTVNNTAVTNNSVSQVITPPEDYTDPMAAFRLGAR